MQLQNQQYASVPVSNGNKENNKRTNENNHNSKVALKPREFGREITNATSSTANSEAYVSKNRYSAHGEH